MKIRLIVRVILVPFKRIHRLTTEEQDSAWNKIFEIILSNVSSVVGDVIRIGQWVHTTEGREFYQECLGIVSTGFGEEGKGTRFAKMWGCALLAARKVSK